MAESIGYITLIATIEREDRQFVSYCPQLGVSSCGDSVEEAYDNLKDAVAVYLSALEETGERARVLAEKRIKIQPRPGISLRRTIPKGKFISECDLPIKVNV